MGRRIPSFPIRFELFKPTRFSKEESVMYFAHEWDAHQKSLHHDDEASPTTAVSVSPAKTVASDIDQATAQNAAPPGTPAPVAISYEPSPSAAISPTSPVPSSAPRRLPRELPPISPATPAAAPSAFIPIATPSRATSSAGVAPS